MKYISAILGNLLPTLTEERRAVIKNAYEQLELLYKLDCSELGEQRATAIMFSVIDEEMQRPEPGPPPSCKAGCSFCCYMHVEISRQEAINLLPFLQKEDMPLLQRQAEKNLATWEDLPYKDRKCVFLKNNLCSAYSARPSACRKWLVRSDPALCNTEHDLDINQKVDITLVVIAELANAVLLNDDGGGNTLSKQLVSLLNLDK